MEKVRIPLESSLLSIRDSMKNAMEKAARSNSDFNVECYLEEDAHIPLES
jgi:hypothetical protein